MDISEIGHYIGRRVRLRRGGGTEEEGTVEHVQTVTSVVGASEGAPAREIIDGYVLVLEGRHLEFTPGDRFEVLEDP
jgi:hypothetical protein